MYKKLRKLSSTTPISSFPEIYNHNNKIISEEMDYYYDSSTGRLIRSVYVPQGKVQAYNGEFRTLNVDNIVINNPATLINNIVKRAYVIPHNAFGNNFYDSSIEKTYENINKTLKETICHDSSVIVVQPFTNMGVLGLTATNAAQDDTMTLYKVTAAIAKKFVDVDASIAEINQKLEDMSFISDDGKEPTFPDGYEDFQVKPVEEETTYPKTYMYATIVQLKRQGLSPLHIDDLKQENAKQHTYYPVENPMIVNNDNYIAIECPNINRIITVKFNRTNETKPFMFLMSRKNKNEKRTYLKVRYDEMNCLKLKCVDYTERYGTVWDIDSWSGSKENFEYIQL